MTPLVSLGGSVVLNAAAQVSLRYSTLMRKEQAMRRSRIWLGVWAVCFAVATVLWIAAIRKVDISYAYPLLGAGYVLVTLLAKLFLSERITPLRFVAILIITAGVVTVGVNQ